MHSLSNKVFCNSQIGIVALIVVDIPCPASLLAYTEKSCIAQSFVKLSTNSNLLSVVFTLKLKVGPETRTVYVVATGSPPSIKILSGSSHVRTSRLAFPGKGLKSKLRGILGISACAYVYIRTKREME